VYLPYLEECKTQKAYDDVVLASATHLPFREMAFDTVLLLQVIEHLSKECGLQALNECERVGSQVLITTPVGFLPQRPYDNNPYQTHVSGWTPKEMKKKGYEVRGFSGLFVCWTQEGQPIFRSSPGLFCVLILTLLTQPFVFHLPNLAFQMLCIKRQP
jgi:hypothetical protein